MAKKLKIKNVSGEIPKTPSLASDKAEDNNFFIAHDPVQQYGKHKEITANAEAHDYATLFGGDSEYRDNNTNDIMAQRIVEQIAGGVLSYEHLSRVEKYLVYRFFYRRNPILGRVIDQHTDIPLSKLRLQAPQGVPEIARDYIVDFYQKIFDRTNFEKVLREAVVGYFIYGDSKIFIDDYFEDDKQLQHLENSFDENIVSHTEEDEKFIADVEERYNLDPESVNLQDRLQYLEAKFLGFFSKTYQGPDKIRVIDPFDINEIWENKDIDYESIDYTLSDSFSKLLGQSLSLEDLKDIGYSDGFINLYASQENQGTDSMLIDNDHLEGLPFLFSIKRYEGASIIERVLDECLEWYTLKSSFKTKIQNLGRIGRIVTASSISQGQVEMLRAEVFQMLEDPGHAVVANFDISWDEVNAVGKEEINEIMDMGDTIISNLMIGLGMPESLVSGESQYSGDSIKLEVLNTQYLSFKQDIQTILEEKFLKPIALRKGFISTDSWGVPTLIYPKVTFSKVSIRNDEIYDILFSLYQKGSLPVGILYDILNIETEDIQRGIEQNLFTVLDPNFNDIISDIQSTATDDIYSESDVKEKLMEAMLLTPKEPAGGEEDEEDSFSF